ncbi:hypothetical protein AAC03nite_31360 [Alicyclobacillus acidoterrestris]|nr:hypothetical protein AAC03nite_31360 [Alicyclobacillus acidoterrestris]
MGTTVMVGLLGLIRIASLTAERVSLHGLGRVRQGALATMGVGFGGAAIVLWIFAASQGQLIWIGSTIWTGILYAVAFGLYTISLSDGPVGVVSPWTNAIVVMLWLLHPFGSAWSLLGLALFAIGAWLLTVRQWNRAVLLMILSDALLAIARLIDVANRSQPPIAYAASLFTAIGLWMIVPSVFLGKTQNLAKLFFLKPGLSIVAASTNAIAYITLFAMLRWVNPAVIEALSTMSSVTATIVGVVFLHETHGLRKLASATLMTLGTVCLLIDSHLS